MTKELNDSLDDLFGGPVSGTPREAFRAPETYVPNKSFIEGCTDCRGTGWWRAGYRCFKCKGAGKLTFKSSPEARAAERAKAVQKKQDKARELLAEVQAWQETNPEDWAWMRDNAVSFEFASAMVVALHKFGSLTEGQHNAVKRCIEKNAAMRKAAEERKAAEIANAPVVASEGIDRLKAAFDKAIAYSAERGMKRYPKITIGSVVLAPAKPNSKNPGALYVTEGQQYLGKIAGGKFFAVRECSEAQKENVLKFIADPQAASEVYGRETGTCCICNATLTSEWRKRGIGPICAEKFGW